MGVADRDYMHDRPAPMGPGFAGGPLRWSVTTWLIVLNVAVFVLDAVLLSTIGAVRLRFEVATPFGLAARDLVMSPLQAWGHFSTATTLSGLQLWRLLGFQFLHGGLGHLFGNMIGLWVFGSIIEDVLGSRRFLLFYLLCGLAGPAAYLAFQAAGALAVTPFTPLIGASAGVYGVLIAATVVAPRTRMQMLFPPVEIELRTLAWVLLGVATFTLFTRGTNAGGEAAHLGGAAVGYLLIRRPNTLAFVDRWGLRLPGYRPRTRAKYMRYRP